MGGANKNEIKIKKIYFVIEVLDQTEGAVLHLQHLYSPCKSQCFIGANRYEASVDWPRKAKQSENTQNCVRQSTVTPGQIWSRSSG